MGTIYIQINNIIEAYLRKEFKSDKGPIVINRSHAVGKFISCHVRWSVEKPEQKTDAIEIQIPDSRFIDQEFFYGYMTQEDRRSVMDYIYAKFDLSVETFFTKAYRYNFKQKDIINSIVNYYNLPISSSVYEMIKKRDFRKRINIKKVIADLIENT